VETQYDFTRDSNNPFLLQASAGNLAARESTLAAKERNLAEKESRLTELEEQLMRKAKELTETGRELDRRAEKTLSRSNSPAPTSPPSRNLAAKEDR
jgi:hypothetical protein